MFSIYRNLFSVSYRINNNKLNIGLILSYIIVEVREEDEKEYKGVQRKNRQ